MRASNPMVRALALVLPAALPLPAPAAASTFELVAYEAPGMLPFPGEIIIPDARTRLPAALGKCGAGRIAPQERTDGVVAVRFEATEGQLSCIRKAVPAGVEVHRLHGEGGRHP